VVSRVVSDAQASARRKGPRDVETAREDAEEVGVVDGDVHEHVVGEDLRAEELEDAVLRRLDRGDVPGEAVDESSPLAARLAEDPPVVSIRGAVVLIALGLHALHDPLVDRREAPPDVLGLEAEEIDHVDSARARHEIPAVAVRADVFLDSVDVAKTEALRVLRLQDETTPMKGDAAPAQ